MKAILFIALLSLSGCSPFDTGHLIYNAISLGEMLIDELPEPDKENENDDRTSMD